MNPKTLLRFNIAPTAEEMSRRAAAVVIESLRQDPELLFCASAGGTPTLMYEMLGKHAVREPKLFERMRVVLIDEWLGLPPGHPATCKQDVTDKLLRPLRISKSRFAGFDSQTTDPERDCARIARWLDRNGPIDICVLGLGKNGHIGMNEPGPAFNPSIHVSKLAPISRKHPMLVGSSFRPTHGMTLGLRDILSSRQVLLLVSGVHKADALAKIYEPRSTPRFPASALYLHPHAEVFCDRAAAGSER